MVVGSLVLATSVVAFVVALSGTRVLLVLTFTPMAFGLFLLVAGVVEGVRASGRTVSRAQWRADPTGRHQARFWDGAAWTAKIRDAGAEADDPIAEDAQGQEAS
jgi:hypothetical protein